MLIQPTDDPTDYGGAGEIRQILLEVDMPPNEAHYKMIDKEIQMLCNKYLAGVWQRTACILRFHSPEGIAWTSRQIKHLGAGNAYDVLCAGCDKKFYPESSRPKIQPKGSKRAMVEMTPSPVRKNAQFRTTGK